MLPDEQLLMPMLYSLPEEIGDVNLTMGYPLRLSSVATFVSLLRRMESSRRKTGDSVGYYYKDLDMLLSHPFSRLLFDDGVTKVKEWMRRHHKYVVDISEVRDMAADMSGCCVRLKRTHPHRMPHFGSTTFLQRLNLLWRRRARRLPIMKWMRPTSRSTGSHSGGCLKWLMSMECRCIGAHFCRSPTGFYLLKQSISRGSH